MENGACRLNGGHDGSDDEHGGEGDHDAVREVVDGEVERHVADADQDERLKGRPKYGGPFLTSPLAPRGKICPLGRMFTWVARFFNVRRTRPRRTRPRRFRPRRTRPLVQGPENSSPRAMARRTRPQGLK
jgi:hypothetical protein